MSANGNEIAASLYKEHGKSLRNYVRRLVPGYELSHAEDVVQETFVRAVRHLNNGKAIDSPKGFLYTTARNLITSMFYRGRKHTETDSMPDMDEYALQESVSSLEHGFMLNQKLDALSVAIAALPQRYQEAFVRRRIWGESCPEIAVAMRLSEKAVSNYAALGWKLLGEYCEEHDIVLNDFSETD
ncbi:MAG: sigma-70 family RNA polymerase sigma factor [Pseudomonadota bacterium]